MSDLLRLAGRQDEARDIIIFLRDELVGDGALRLVAAAAATLPIRAAWDESESTSLLARAFSLLVRLDKRRIPNSLQGLALYEETLASQEKGALLEHILDVLSRHPADSINLQKDIYKELISTYEPRMFPVRRLRVISNFVQSNPDLRREIIEEARNTITLASLDSVIENSHDTNLRSYVPHFQSLLTSSLELLENHPRIDLIRPHLATWCGMIEKCKDKETLYRNVDDVDGFLSHLQSIADFLDMKGFGKLRTAVLRMITNIDEIPRESSSDDLVLDYSFLADQYLDLGYSGKAGLALDRAQCCSTSNGVTPSVLVRKLVSYAAYLLKMGNLDKW
jgi:separase